MATVVSDNSLGLLNTSLYVLGTGVGEASHGRAGEQVFVNAATGNLVVQNRDELVVGRGPDLSLLRTYNSQGLLNDDNGDNWRLGVYRKIYGLTGTANTAGSTVKRVAEDGSESTYNYDASLGKYVNRDGAGAYDTLAWSNITQLWTWTGGTTQVKETYDGANGGRLTQVQDIDGNSLAFTYNAAGLITQVTDASGETTYLDYSGINLTQLRTLTSGGQTVIRTSYSYDTSNRLTQVKTDLTPDNANDNVSYSVTYTYDGTSRRVASMAQSDGSNLAITYAQVGADYRVASLTDALGRVTSFAYNTSARTTTVTDPLGLITVLAYDTSGQLTSITAPAVNGVAQTLSYAYDGLGNVTGVTDAKGNVVSYQYDAAGNRTLERDVLGNTVTRIYGAKNELLAKTVYLVPDPDGAGAGQPAGPLTTRYVYDANNHLRFTVTADGKVSEYRYNGFGQQIAAIQYTGSRYDISTLSPGSTLSESQLVAWLPADRSGSKRVDTTYDFRGQLASTTSYQTINAAGNGVADGTQAVTQYVYDQAGNVLKTIDARGSATADPNDYTTAYVYDGLGRVLSTTDALGHVTLTQYDDANRKTVLTLANGLISTSTYDVGGNVISALQSANGATLGETKYFYDLDGRLRRTEDPTGVKLHMLYDETGRKIATIDGDGTFTEYRYDANNNVTRTIQYANPVSAANLAALIGAGGAPANVALAAIRPAASASDRSVWAAYDSANRLVKSVDASGAVTQNFYDGVGRVTDVVRFATTISTATLTDTPSAASINPPSSANDRLTRAFYDPDGNLRGALDGEGYLVEYKYDAAGQLTETIGYATATNAGLRATGTLAQLIPAVNAADIHSYTLYNARGQAAATVDAEGYLTETVYDVAGNKTLVVRYATKVAYSAGATLAALRPAANPQDRASAFAYTATNQLASTTNAEGTVTQHIYDAVGNVIKTVQAAGASSARALLAQYDKQGRLVAELSANGANQLTGNQTQAEIDAIWTAFGTKHSYDAAGRRTSSTDANGRKTLLFYNADGNLTHAINALGEVKESVYNALGQVTQTIQYGTRLSSAALAGLNGGLVNTALTNAVAAIQNAALDSKVTYTYYTSGKVQQTTDPLGNATSQTFNAFGDMVNTSQALGGGQTLEQTYSYDRRGLVTLTVSDPTGVNVTSVAVYDAFGRAVQSTDARGNVRTASYDKLGRIIVSTDPLNHAKSSTYDAFDRLLTQTDASGATTSYSYDSANRSVTITTPEGVMTTTVTNRHGETTSITDGRGHTTSYHYDDNGNLISVDAPAAGTTTNVYDNANLLVETFDALGTRTTHTYDAANRLLTRTVDTGAGHLNLVSSYGYDAKGQTVSMTDANGVVTQTTFDLNGQVTQVAIDPAGLNLRTSYSYDARGKTLTVTEGAGSSNPRVTQYIYDKLGRLTQERADPNGINATTTYVYDKNNNVSKTTDALGNAMRYAYDANDRLVYTVNVLGGVTKNEYDVNGRVSRYVGYANTISLAGLSDIASVADIAARISASSTDEIKSYVYDADGREIFCIDALGAVTRKTYDANGNVVRTVEYANLIPVGTALTRSAVEAMLDTSTSRDRVTRVAYDAANRAVFVVDAANYVKETQYDQLGRVIKTIQHTQIVNVSDVPSATEVQAAVAPATTPVTEINWVPVQNVTLAGQTSTVAANPVQPYTYAAAAKNDVASAASQVAGLTVQNTTVLQSSQVANYAWYRSGNSIYTTGGQSIVAGQVSFGDATPTGVRATVYDANGNYYGQAYTDVGYWYTDSWTQSYQYISGYDESGNPEYATGTYTATGNAWSAVNNWSGQVNLPSMAAGHYSVVLETWDSVNPERVEGGYYDFTDGTWSYSNTIGVDIGTVVKPTYVSWATSVAPAGTTASLKYRVAGSTGAYTNASVAVSGNNHQANLGAINAGNYEYVIEYTDSYNRVLKSAGGTLTATAAQTTSTNATFNFTQITSTPSAGSSISGYITAAEVPTIEYVDATVRDIWGNVLSTARTYPEFESSYNGNVNLKVGATLADGRYVVSIAVRKKDGTVENRTPFTYDIGQTNKLQHTLSWPAGVQPADTTPVFRYRPAGTSYAYVNVPVTTAGGNAQALLDWTSAGNYEYIVEYKDGSGKILHAASGTFTVPASGDATSTIAFSHRETTVSWSQSTQPFDTTAVFTYAPLGSSSYTSAPIVAQNGELKATLVNLPDGNYNYVVRYYSGSTVIREAAGAVTVGAGLSATDTLAFITLQNGIDPALIAQVNTFSYDAGGRLASSTDAEGVVERFTYDAVGNKLSFTNKKGSTWTYTYDANRRLLSEITPQVAIASVVDNSGTISATSTTAAIETRMTYDALGNVLTRTEAFGRPEARTTQYQYDALGRQFRTIFPAVSVYDSATDNLATNGVSGTVARVETTVAPEVTVTFDALSNATVNRDTGGNHSYKVYDALRRVRYEIDAERYVTEFGYDGFGNKTTTTRYATALNFGAVAGYAAHTDGTPFTLAEVAARLAPSSADRTITTQYDALNRATQVIQPAAYTYDSTASGGAPLYFTLGATTRNTYNAFGQVIKQSALKNPGADLAVGNSDDVWLDTYFYYDRRGNKSAQVDALGYLTASEYDETGDLIRQVEYARALTVGSWNTSGYGTPSPTTLQASPASAIGYDREVTYQYDRKNQKIAETRVNAEFGTVTGTLTLGTTVGNLTTTYTYDALGNLTSVTDPTGATSYNYYDALGRTTATAAPARFAEGGSGAVVMPPVYVSYDRAANTTTLSFAKNAPSDSVIAFRYRVAGAPAWITATLTSSGTNYTVNLTGLPSDRYQYELTYTRNGESTAYATGNGQFNVFGPTGVGSGNVVGSIEQPTFSFGIAASAHVDQTLGTEGGYESTWNGYNQVNLSWNSLDSLGTGNVRVRLNYDTARFDGLPGAGISTYRDITYSAAQAATGIVFAWSDPETAYAGVYSISSIQVWKVVDGQEALVINSASGYTQSDRLLLRGNTAGLTGINVAGVGTLAATALGAGVYSVDLGGLNRGAYSFTPIGTASAVGGTFDVTHSSAPGNAGLQEINATSATRTLNAYRLPANAASAVLQYRQLGSNGPYISKTLTTGAGSGELSVGYDDIANGRYDYLLTVRDAAGNLVNLSAVGGSASGTLSGNLTIKRGGDLPLVALSANALTLTPLTTQAHDAFGNVVQTTDYAKGALAADATSYGVAGTDAADQVSVNFHDSHGHVIRSVDAEGASRYSSYDVFGHIVKSWQPITDNDGLINNAVQVFQYDRLGQQTETIEPSYLLNQTLFTTGAPAADALSVGWSSSSAARTDYSDESGAHYYWSGWNAINVGWSDMSGWGNGNIVVRAYYNTGNGNATYRDTEVGPTATSANFSWFDPGNEDTDGGISSVSAVQVWKRDVNGTQRQIHYRSTQGAYGSQINIALPQQPGTGVEFKYVLQGQSNWATATLYNMGSRYIVDTSGLNGAYNYEILYTRPSESRPYAHSQGTFSVSGSIVTALGINNSTATSYTPALNPTNFATTQAQYNAFGDIVTKGLNGGAQEYYHYDGAGRLWRTNDKDGIDKVALYDLQGKATAQIQSQTLDLRNGYSSASQIAALTSVQRTDTRYDALGRVTGQVQPSFTIERAGLEASPITLSVVNAALSVNSYSGAQWVSDGEGGYNWNPTSSISLGWNTDLAQIGAGNVYIQVDYVRADGSAGWNAQEVASAAATTGVSLSWADMDQGTGTGYVTRVRVWKRDVSNNLLPIFDQGAGGGQRNLISWAVPTEVGTGVSAQYLPAGAAGWSQLAVYKMGARYYANTFSASNYDVEVFYARPGEASPYAHSTATVSINAGTGSLTNTTTVSGVIAQTVTPTLTQTLDRWGNAIGVFDARGFTTSYRYNYLDKLIEEQKPTVDVWGANGANTPARPLTRSYYDKVGRAVGSVDANGNPNTLRYDAAGQLIAEYHADGGVVSYQYDTFGRRTRTVDAVGNVTTHFYDRNDRLVRETHPIGEDNIVYDQAGNRVRVTNAAGEITRYWYDTRGKLIRTQLPGGQQTNEYYDLKGFKVRQVTANNDQPTSTYDYFGRLLARTDMGGAVFTYTYDRAGHTTQQATTRLGSTYATTYSYYENGSVKRITDAAVGGETFYEYDAAGNRTRERYIKSGTTYLDNRIAYDALNHLQRVQDNRYTINYRYDANGNRRHTNTFYYDAANVGHTLDSWYLYDSMNRIVLSQGVLQNAQIVITQDTGSGTTLVKGQGVALQYDAAGNRRVATTYEGTSLVSESYTYDANNQLLTTNRAGLLTSARSYDLAGRVTQDISYSSPGVVKERRENTYFTGSSGFVGKVQRQEVFNSAGTLVQATTYTAYDPLGNTVSYQTSVYQGSGYTNYFSYAYAKYDGYKEKTVNGSSTYFQPGQTTTTYDFNGNIVSVTDQFAANRNRTFITDGNGMILQKAENGQTQYYFYANGNPVGSSGALSAADFDYNYTPVSAQYPGATPSSYIVSSGDTLRSIALAVFGDAQLWYLIGDTNGIRADSDLKVGQQLVIPNKISNLHNDYATHAVYAPGEIIGDTTPTLPDPPPPPPPPKKKCGGFAMILMVIVAVVVTVFTAGAALAALGPILSAAVGAMAGSIASQLVGMGLGVVDKFSWKQVAIAGISGGIGAGVSAGMAALTNGMNATAASVLTAVAQNAVNQGISIMSGQQQKFSWQSVAMSAVAPIAKSAGEAVGKMVGDSASGVFGDTVGKLAGNVAGKFTSGVVTQGLSVLIQGQGKVEYAKIAADSFSNVLGNALVDKAKSMASDWLKDTIGSVDGGSNTSSVGSGSDTSGSAGENKPRFFDDDTTKMLKTVGRDFLKDVGGQAWRTLRGKQDRIDWRGAAASAMESTVARYIGDKFNNDKGSVGHMLSHAALGAGVAALRGKDAWAGAIGGASSVLFTNIFGDDLRSVGGNQMVTNYSGQFGAALADAFGRDGAVAANAARNEAANNWGKHPNGKMGCFVSGNGNELTCSNIPGVKGSFTVDRPKDFPNIELDPDGGTEGWHLYGIPIKLDVDPDEARAMTINCPVPGTTNPATPEGTFNDATPTSWADVGRAYMNSMTNGYYMRNPDKPNPLDGYISPVKSYVRTDEDGNQFVVNVTLPGHLLFPGVVVRPISPSGDGSVVKNVGFGTAYLQNRNSIGGWFAADTIEDAWIGQTKGMPTNPSCKR